ncbi:molybdopterin converting factor subunit 1 [Halioxenophilus sp. WMMB6]|uniref:molybdopterin converting factor subunit 1 n=1 Tax=Halioxenophilus sp. WMMB6 TaxID=3073815 RepID=UPI00295E4D9E|nr:molybdopterin converting factor subunit 1 [Halioxenophilus sp. WMMB6]
MIQVLFFARLRDQLGTNQMHINLDEINGGKSTTVADLIAYLCQRNSHWQSFLMEQKLFSAVNQTVVPATTALTDNDEVAFFPPVTGG